MSTIPHPLLSTEKSVQVTSVSLVALSCISIVALNILNVPSTDDWCNTMKSWQDVLVHPINLYFSWTGRFVSSLLLGFFLYLPSWVFTSLNIGITLCALFCCVRLGVGYCTIRRALALGAMAYMLLWFFLPTFGEVMLWTTGSIVYLWTTTALLAWLIPYRRLLEGRECVSWGTLPTAAFGLFSLLAGNSMEHASFCALLMAGCILLLCKHRKVTIPAWAWWGIGCLFAGWILLMAAPGNYARAGGLPTAFLALMMKHSIKIFKFMLEPFIAVPVLYVLACCIGVRFRPSSLPHHAMVAVFFVFFGILNMLALIPTPIISDRTVAPSYFFILCGIITLVNHYANTIASHIYDAIAPIAPYIALSIILLFTTSIMNTSWSYLRERNNFFAEQKIIKQSLAAGSFDIDIPEFPTTADPRNYYHGKRLSPDPQHWRNICFSKCYGVNSVRFGYTKIAQ